MLYRRKIIRIDRHGKQLALIGCDRKGDASCVCVHLGMSGSLRYFSSRTWPREMARHTHVVWRLDNQARITYRDPRRFGGIWTYATEQELTSHRWSKLGPDACAVTAAHLKRRVCGRSRTLKGTLLDQQILAGLGNIYVDELLWRCRLHPQTPCNRLSQQDFVHLVRNMRSLMQQAISAGGSTFRDYKDSDGRPGKYQKRHRVYGRATKPCFRCGRHLEALRIASRQTVFCPGCQKP